jgi:hypothetical protein
MLAQSVLGDIALELDSALPLFTELPRSGLLGNSLGQGCKNKKSSFGVADSALYSILSLLVVEAENFVLYVGTWDEGSRWCNRLP